MWVLAGALVLGCNEPTGPLSLPAAVGRPDEASQGPRVGVIVTLGGQVTIVPSKGKAFPGLPDRQLLRDDKLVTAADSFVVVQLHNGHLVRLGASQNNVVEMLAPFHDPQAGEDVEDRFVRLLTPDELKDPALSGAITRVAGWNTRMSASQSFAALPTSELAKAPAPVSVAPPDSPGGSPGAQGSPAPPPAPPGGEGKESIREKDSDTKNASSPRADTKPAPAKIEESRKPVDESRRSPGTDSELGSSANTGKGSVSPTDDDGAGDVPPPAQAPESEAPSAPHLPAKVAFRPAAGGQAHTENLPEPLRTGGPALAACAGAGAKITGIVKGGKLTTLKVDGQLKCQTLVGKASTLPDGNFELTVLK